MQLVLAVSVVESLRRLVAIAGEALVALALGAGYVLYRRGRVRAVWVGVEKSPGLSALHGKIDQALIRAGLPPEGRKYIPHVTIGRLKDARSNRVLGWLEANGAFFAPPFKAGEFVLYESRLGRHGPSYLPVHAYPLDAPS